MTIADNFHSDALRSFQNYKLLAERALDQVSDEDFFRQIDSESNSVAVLVKHIAGNAWSRWREFLTSDGEKDDRRRDTEFEITAETRDELMQLWDKGWATLFENVEPLTADQLAQTVSIRGEAYTVVEAINRQLTHYAYHVGQIVLLAKHYRSSEWRSLSVPRNCSDDFNRFMDERNAAGEKRLGTTEAPLLFADNEHKKAGPVS